MSEASSMDRRVRLTPLQGRIVDMLEKQPRRRMNYHDLGAALWPASLYPNASRYSSNGGPPGWAMPLGRALRELGRFGLTHEQRNGRKHGDVCLLSNQKVIGGTSDAP